jgi:D-alanyl-D-alanine carboxypeptidase/D-alanyl-D-alanine-endopeptidase (penicillin-binding protein 4)
MLKSANRKMSAGFFAAILLLSLMTPNGLPQTSGKDQLKAAIEEIISKTELGNPTIGIFIQCAKGEILYEQNQDAALKPASCHKIQTGAAALHYLGKNFRYATTLCMQGRISGKILEGDLVVKGSGDPSISGRFAKDPNDITWIFRNWAKELKKLGISKITGDVIGDDDYFDDQYFGPGWTAEERGEWYSAEISALSFNDNCVDVLWKGSGGAGKEASYKLNPETSFIIFVNEVTIGDKGLKETSFSRKDKKNVIMARGRVPKGKSSIDWCTIYNPTLYCATVLKETLQKEGIEISGVPLDLDDDPARKEIVQSDSATSPVAVYESPPLMTLLDIVDAKSQNFYAEQIYKTIGRRVKGEGSFLRSSDAVQEFLKKEKLFENGSVVMDGSGLSYLNRVSPRQLVGVLRYLSQKPYWHEYLDTLPRGGKKGYLIDIWTKTAEEMEIAPRIYGKTGYIGGVVGLTGVVYDANGREIFYSILINGFEGSVDSARSVANAIAFEVARSSIP